MHKRFTLIASFILISFAAFFAAGCSGARQRTVVIWTNNAEFAQYIELFNSTHDNVKALLVYKENPVLSLPPAKGELYPDIIVGPGLRSEKVRRYLSTLDTVFDHRALSSAIFYSQLLSAGKMSHSQYLLPVSFNLPAVIFSSENKELVEDNYLISLDQIRQTAAAYNKKNPNGMYSRIGFAPQNSAPFMYLVAKTKGARFREYRNSFTWNKEQLANALAYIKTWTDSANTSSKTEQDFAFKYLYMSPYKQVTSGRCLFSYTTSNELFRMTTEQLSHIDFRWIREDKKIPLEDSVVMLGVARYAKHKSQAYDFISWFMNADTQRTILETKAKNNLDTDKFGLCGGFSAIKEVNEHYLPIYYTSLLANTPPADALSVPEKIPSRWENMKADIILPYLKDAVSSDGKTPVIGLDERISDWLKQSFNN